jgi:P-type conjugative transfer protein TrbJ
VVNPFPLLAACRRHANKTTKGNAMKKLIALTLVTVGVGMSAQAQWVVFDPTMNVQQIIDTAEEIAQFVTMVDNQVTQIETLTDQLSEFKNYENLFGNRS